MDIFKKWLLVFVLGACTTSSVVAETQFSRGKSWLSKNTYRPAVKSAVPTAEPVARAKSMDATPVVDEGRMSSGGVRVYDIAISMYRDRTEEERTKIGNIITNFAYAVYEATDGKHKVGVVTIGGKAWSSFADVRWGGTGTPSSGTRALSHGKDELGSISMYDNYVGTNNQIRSYLNDPKAAAYALAHEWAHYRYGLLDEYREGRRDKQGYKDKCPDKPHSDDEAVVSIMGTVKGAEYYAALNFSIAAECASTKLWRDTCKTAQHRTFGQSCRQQLRSPSVGPSYDKNGIRKEFKSHYTPLFEEFAELSSIPRIDFNVSSSIAFSEVSRRATDELKIIWASSFSQIIWVLLDMSGSMGAGDVANLKSRVIELLSHVSEGTRVGAATFTTETSNIFPLTAVTHDNRADLKSKISNLPSSGSGNTDIWDAAWNGLEELSKSSDQCSAASIILLTDGQNGSSTHGKDEVIMRCIEMGVAFNSIAYGSNADGDIKEASKGTGGLYYSATQGGNSLSEAFLRQHTYSSSRVTLADYTCKKTLLRSLERTFYVDSFLTNVNMSVVIGNITNDAQVSFVSPSGRVYSGGKTETSTGVTYDYSPMVCELGEWRIVAHADLGSEVSFYADATSCGDALRVNGDVVDEKSLLVVNIDAQYSITGAQVVACIPCDGYIRDVPFDEDGCGCYTLPLSKCGPELVENGLSVCCQIRKGEAFVDFEDPFVSPSLYSGSESVTEDKTRVLHFAADELKTGYANVQASGDAVVGNVKISSRWPFDSRIDIDFTVTCEDCGQTRLLVVGYDHDLNRQMTATTLSGADLSNPIGSGTYRVTWDIGKDYPGFHAKKFSVRVFSAYAQVEYDVSHGGNGSGIELSWNDFGNGSVSYQIWRSTQSDVSKADLLATVKSGPYVDTTAIPGVLYYYWIRAIGPEGVGDFGYPRVGYRDIDAPISVQASDGTSSEAVEVSWSAVEYSTAYEVWRGTADTLMCCEPERLAVVADTHYSDATAIPGVDYWYWIRTRAPACTSGFSENDQGYRALVAPTDVSATDGTSVDGVTISWGGSVPGVEYEVYRSETSSVSDAKLVGSSSDSMLTDKSAIAGHANYYWVRAVSGLRVSDFAGPDRGWRAAKLSGTALYLVVDVSEGASATKYPFYELNAIPGGTWSDEYKTTKIVLRRCSAGNFYMGSPSGETGRNSANEKRHKVTLTKPFYLGVFEITQTQWTLVIGSNPSRRNGEARVMCPVEAAYDWIVPGKNAISFVGQLRSKTGLAAFDLPTEAQWEYACRAGTTTAINTGKSLGSQYEDANMSQAARYMYTEKDNDLTRYNRVGCYLPNAWGFYDMHGNVAEWCLDYYTDSLGTTATKDPTGPTSGPMRVLRGGSYADYAKDCRSASRTGAQSRVGNDSDEDYVGFRLFKSIP